MVTEVAESMIESSRFTILMQCSVLEYSCGLETCPIHEARRIFDEGDDLHFSLILRAF